MNNTIQLKINLLCIKLSVLLNIFLVIFSNNFRSCHIKKPTLVKVGFHLSILEASYLIQI